jgi:hypothetical protein
VFLVLLDLLVFLDRTAVSIIPPIVAPAASPQIIQMPRAPLGTLESRLAGR